MDVALGWIEEGVARHAMQVDMAEFARPRTDDAALLLLHRPVAAVHPLAFERTVDRGSRGRIGPAFGQHSVDLVAVEAKPARRGDLSLDRGRHPPRRPARAALLRQQVVLLAAG
ncbi:hypothetical protein [Methylobacterium sp. E-066]|uniref:hypothetical protein n=1 Tax=Methylobacterium sp. E-066 TaxID=2836584 RepID=UPI001FB93935|nr:hypothetical protein [Methylobacterium sp. E-066]MCJ2143934.1 hypothetical protein [Methylobacterium sp. E-066]